MGKSKEEFTRQREQQEVDGRRKRNQELEQQLYERGNDDKTKRSESE